MNTLGNSCKISVGVDGWFRLYCGKIYRNNPTNVVVGIYNKGIIEGLAAGKVGDNARKLPHKR